MSEVKQSVVAALGVGTCLAMVVLGSFARSAVDTKVNPVAAQAQETALRTSGLVASKQLQVPEADYFYEMSRLLKREYVEGVTDDQKLVSGAVRGMVLSLNDSGSVFMDKDEFNAFKNRRMGIYEGIGADFILKMPPAQAASSKGADAMPTLRVPSVVVSAVTPNGPADKAGVKPGDSIVSVNGHWVLDGDLINRFRAAQRDFQAKKLSLEKLNAFRKEVREKTEHSIMPMRAMEKLILGKSGNVTVVWRRAGADRKTAIAKGESKMPGVVVKNGALMLPFVSGAPAALKAAVAENKSLKIDLRNNAQGDYNVMMECLALLGPSGQYGTIQSQKPGKPKPFTIAKGNDKPVKVTLLVDKATRGAAEIFATALSTKGVATIEGGPMAGDKTVQKIVELPDGSGYTLTTGEFKPTKGATK